MSKKDDSPDCECWSGFESSKNGEAGIILHIIYTVQFQMNPTS